MDDELEQLLADLEDEVAAEVRAVLDEVADEFAEGLNSATEIVAARFSVSSIARSWASRMPRLVRRLLRVSETASQQAADLVDGTLPDDWDDLPARYDDDTLPPRLGDYVTATEHLLRAVGERLASVATQELADGLNAGDTIDQLRARLRAAFDREGAQLGDVREERIARTESVRAWNAATLAAAQTLSGSDRPLVKQWRTRGDDRVRHSHADVDGFVRLLDDAFSVGGTDMQYPGDPTAPADQTVNCRCVLVLANADRTAAATGPEEAPMDDDETHTDTPPPVRAWSTPDATALAFENQETGDGRIFSPGALQWANGPWPLMYADKNLGGHDGSELAGAIQTMARDGDRITGSGVLYLTADAGWEAEQLLQQGAPLGVSVDLDDVDIEFVDRTTDAEAAEAVTASFATASVLRLADGTYHLQAHTAPKWDVAGTSLVASSHTVDLYTGTDGTVSAAAVHAVLPGTVTAAAGDPDNTEHGTVVHTESSGDVLVRITRARVRGATLVSVPAFADARIVLDPEPAPAPADDAYVLAAAATTTRDKVITYVRTSPSPVTAREIADRFDLTLDAARAHLTAAVESGHLVRIARGQYVAATDLPEGDLAAATDPDTAWDEETMSDLEASAWTAMRDLPAMPAEWFQDPTDLLPDGAPGVNFADGRIFGWVARAGEPHAGYPGKKLTIESLGKIDTSHFLRQRFTLDDGSTVKAGAFTMNVGHHRDGAECETASCQFDDTRTVAGIVTVGMSKRGMWFSGAAAPWLSTWDQQVFMASQPSYHMKQARGGWQLRAVLSVPVPGHSTPLVAAMATAVERSNLALTAAAALAEPVADTEPEPHHDRAHDTDVDALTAALLSPQFLDSFADALQRREAERATELAALTADINSIRAEITASTAPTDKEH